MQALPTYVLRANWGKLSESLEVYSMLAQIEDTEGFPEEVRAIDSIPYSRGYKL